MTVTGRVRKGFHNEELWVIREIVNGKIQELISIDRTFYGPEWCRKHGMKIEETVKADNGETFNIWRRANELVCATPVREG